MFDHAQPTGRRCFVFIYLFCTLLFIYLFALVFVTHPSPSPVVMEVHQRTCVAKCRLTSVHELPGEPASVADVVAAAAPLEHPSLVPTRADLGRVAGAVKEVTLAARMRDGVHHAGRRYCVNKGRFSAAYFKRETKQKGEP